MAERFVACGGFVIKKREGGVSDGGKRLNRAVNRKREYFLRQSRQGKDIEGIMCNVEGNFKKWYESKRGEQMTGGKREL